MANETIPQRMRHIKVTSPGGPEMLTVASGPTPKPGKGEALIRVAAAGVNHADLMQREGHYPPPPGAPEILGLEVSGHIVALEPDGSASGTRFRVGDPVCALLAGGGYAEYCVAPIGQCMHIPEGVSLIDSAAIPEAAATVWANLFQPRRIRSGSLVLIQGGSSGVGSMAVQMTRAFGARVAATAGTEGKRQVILGMGAEKAINYRTEDWESELAEWAKPHGFDVILDVVGGDYLPKHLNLLGMEGQLVHIATLGGFRASVDLRQIMKKRLIVTGSTLRSRPIPEKTALLAAMEREVWPLFASRPTIRPVISARLPLSRAADAHRMMEAGSHGGKILLEVNSAL